MERLHRASLELSQLNLKKCRSVADVFAVVTASPGPMFAKESSPVFTKESTRFSNREMSPSLAKDMGRVFTLLRNSFPDPTSSTYLKAMGCLSDSMLPYSITLLSRKTDFVIQRFTGFALVADMAFVQQSAGR
jgi:hypothetical protein